MSEQCLVIGHRGTDLGNSKDAFSKAINMGVDAIEMDVRVTKDGVPVIAHDEDIKNFPVKSTSLRQLRTVEPNLLTLAEALEHCSGTPLIIEIKPHVDVRPIFTVLKSLPESKLQQYKIASFDPRVLKKFLKEMPELPRFVLEKWSGVHAGYKCRRAKTTNVIMAKRGLWGFYIRAVTKRGYTLYTYTLDNPKKANRWIRAGLSGIITDHPERFIRHPGDNA
ncbi:MAG: glycerophosphodiester phosphodiesterase [Candidatus Saccharimonadales bacterium]